ncbi:MAG TPA: MFS transporter [Candidatus Sulfotelmatobacter sp.]|nr:MFS transporter [Candidatus Sulfotelmatobacter sp.]
MQSQTTPRGAWGIAALLFLFMLVNFADKVVVGLAAVPIMQELKLTPQQFGFLGSAFFLLFSVAAVVVGFIVNRVSARWVILVLAAVWALVQFPMLGPVGFTTIAACRIMLGAGEGPAASVALHGMYKWFPDAKRALPTAILSQGSAVGVIVALPALNWVIVHYSWHWAFGALGLAGLCWCLLWLIFGREGPLLDETSEGGPALLRQPYSRLLFCRTYIGCCLALFGAYWALSLGLTWFTPFIVKGLGISQSSAGWIATLPWLMGAIVVIATGLISERLLAAGVSTRLARGVLGAAPMVVGALLLFLLPRVEDNVWRIAILVVGTGLTGSIYVVCPPMIGEFVPVAQRGAMLAIAGAVYSLAGVLAPTVNGGVIEAAATPLQGYLNGFQITALVQLAGGIIGLLLLWPASERARLRLAAA